MFELVMLGVSAGLCVWSLINWLAAWRLHRDTGRLLADCRQSVEQAKQVAAEVSRDCEASDALRAELKRVSEQAKQLHADAVRLLAEADQLARQARDDSE